MTMIGPKEIVFRLTNISRSGTERTVELTVRGLPIGYGFMGERSLRMGNNR